MFNKDDEDGPYLIETVGIGTNAMMTRHFNKKAAEGLEVVSVTANGKDSVVVVWRHR